MFPQQLFSLQLDQAGAPVDPSELTALTQHVGANAITDVLVISHGWNNDLDDARDLYGRLRDRLAAQFASFTGTDARRFALGAVFWPSKKFADQDLIPGGAASANDDVLDKVLETQIATLRDLVDNRASAADFDRLRSLIAQLDDGNEGAQVEFAELALAHLPHTSEDEGDASAQANMTPRVGGRTLLSRLGVPVVAPPQTGRGGAVMIDDAAPSAASQGGAAGIGDFFFGVKAGALNLLNSVTYYKMKERAGTVGRTGVHNVLRTLSALPNAPRLHLAGHSFGARVVSAAALGPDGEPAVPVHSISLLQAAFSHYAFSDNYDGSGKPGFFRRVVSESRVTGPMIVTHTRNDKAVGVGYAVASRLVRQVAAALGDEHDTYGGLGSNGAQATPERVPGDMHAPGQPYQFSSNHVYNLKADPYVSGHSDIANDAVAYAILSAVLTS